MTTAASELIAKAAATAEPVIRGIADDQLSAPTPCPGYDVRGLLDHLLHVVVNFQALARHEAVSWDKVETLVTEDWPDRFAREAAKLAEAWDDPKALDGVSAGMGLPQEMVAKMAITDLVLHPWDLARATGQSYEPDPAAIAEAEDLVVAMGNTGREMGAFGPEVAVPKDADPLTRLLGVSGRDPHWKP